MRPSPGARAAGLAFLTASVTLFMQVLTHRMVSAKLLNNYAFLVISLTMLGFALSGVLLTRLLDRTLERPEDAATLWAALFALSALGASFVFYHADIRSQNVWTRSDFLLNMLRWAPLALLYAIPFVFCGLILGALLSSPRLPTRRIYFSDLLGSSLGAFAVIPSISHLGVETSVVASCAILLAGTLVLAPPKGKGARAMAAAAGLAIVVSLVARERIFEMSYPAGSMLWATRQEGSGMVLEHTSWDPLARIEVSRIPPPRPDQMAFPCLIGSNEAFLARFKRLLTQNNFAFTYAVDYDGNRESLRGIEETIYAAAYQAGSSRSPRVLVIGVGGGFDVLNALYFGASHITGVEINGATMGILTRTYREYFRRWVDDPRVRLVQAEGRHFLATTEDSYDVIQLSGVDSYSGTPGAAYVFSENYLYTAEAFDLYLSRLTPDGILNMMRLEFIPPREMLRALVTAVSALRRAGVERPADHVVMLTATNGYFTALLVKRTPFTEIEERRLEEWAARSPFFAVSASPRLNAEGANLYQAFLSLGDPKGEAAFVRLYPFDVSPTDDNRPFFFKYSFWAHLSDARVPVRMSIPAMEYSVLLLLALVGIAAVLCVYVPLRLLASSGLRTPNAGRYVAFFGGIGVGYLAIEIALLQKFGHFLGHPNYALSVVLAGLLLATGLGSLFSAAITRALGEVRFVGYVLAAIVLLDYGLVFPRLPGWIGLAFSTRCLIVFALLMPIGICLGVFFPSGLERLKGGPGAFAPWAWGINGIFSVLSPVVSVAFSMTWGINALLLAALPVYLGAGWALPGRGASTAQA